MQKAANEIHKKFKSLFSLLCSFFTTFSFFTIPGPPGLEESRRVQAVPAQPCVQLFRKADSAQQLILTHACTKAMQRLSTPNSRGSSALQQI